MLALAARGDVREGDWLVAARQTAGRGRQGRAWVSPLGNLYASGLVELQQGDPLAPTLALVAGIALYDALGVAELMLKWPNDVLADGAKLAGILLERQNDAVVVGVGVNLAHHPDLPDRPSTSLAARGVDMSVDAAIAALTVQVARWLAVWRNSGLVPVCAAWRSRAHPIGAPLDAALPDGTRVTGRFDGLTDDGALRLKLPDGSLRVIHAGDVFLI